MNLNDSVEIPLSTITKGLIQHKNWIIIAITCSIVSSLAWALTIPDRFASTARLMIASPDELQASRIGSISSILNGGGQPFSDQTTYYLETLKSRKFIISFINTNDLKRVIFSDRWNNEAGAWIEQEPSLYQKASIKLFSAEHDETPNNTPSDLQSYDTFITEHLAVRADEKTGVISISTFAHTPKTAQRLLEALLGDINLHLRNTAKREINQRIQYLKKELSLTQASEIKAAIFSSIASQQQELMRANTKIEFAFKVIDPPYQPEDKFGPNRKMIILSLTLATLFICIVISSLITIRRQLLGTS